MGVLVVGSVGWPTAAAAKGNPDSLELLQLEGDAAWVRYTPGSLDRASHVQDWLTYLAEDFARWSKHGQPLGAYLLDRREWQSADLGRPYGYPVAVGQGRVALPAMGDDGTVAQWRRFLARLPQLAGTPLVGTVDEAASLLAADHLALLEEARQLVPLAPLHPQTVKVAEVLAHLTVLSAVRRGEPGRQAELEQFWHQLGGDRHPPISGYVSGISFADWLVYQARFFAAAEVIMRAEHGRPFRHLKRLQKKGGGVLSAGLLVGRYPQLADLLGEAAGAGH